MNENPTKLIDKIYIEEECCKKEVVRIKETPWEKFRRGDTTTSLENIFHKFEKLLEKRWIEIEDNLIYDHRIRACWLGLMEKDKRNFYFPFDKNNNIKEVEKALKEEYKNNELELPTEKEVRKSLTDVNPKVFPFKPYRYANNYYYSLEDIYAMVCKGNEGKTFNYNLGNYYSTYPHKVTGYTNYFAYAIPILRLGKDINDFNLTNREVFFKFVAKKLIPTAFKDDKKYLSLLDTVYFDEKEGEYKMKKEEIKEEKTEISEEKLIEKLLNEDTIRADLSPYNKAMIENIKQGHWSLWDMDTPTDERSLETKLKGKLVARNPASDIKKNGIIGIDFGTKSTVVVYQDGRETIHPMRIGTGRIYDKVSAKDYENPTIMEFKNLKKFIKDYNSREYRPETEWNDVTISHTANNALKGSSSKQVNTFLTELKQWAGDKYKQLKLIDSNDYTIDLPAFLDIEKDFNPIEVYAYYLGLYINNQYNGIFLNYLLSFPVTYEISVRKKILESFEKGLKKSLPPQLDESYINKLKVKEGASEPAAYAIVALEEYGFENEFDEDEDKKIFYGVFDFGGGTTDFDFGLFRATDEDNKKEESYDFAIEHFGAGGDKFLGGENLLELLAFEVFKKNREVLLENHIQFEKHPEKDVFAGSGALLSNSREAMVNTKTLMEELRGFWENDPEEETKYNDDLKINLADINGKLITNFELKIEKDELKQILSDRIEKGVKAFFTKLKDNFKRVSSENSIDKVNIFLAGNSSKSTILKEIFDKEIAEQEKIWRKENIVENDNEIFKVFEPLTSDENNKEKPTGKTGVAFGLIIGRKTGDYLVIDNNIEKDEDGKEKEIGFKFYLGKAKRKKFRVFPPKEEDSNEKWEYNEWKRFINAMNDQFEIYYTSNPSAITDKLSIYDESIKKMIINLDETNDDADVYIRLVSPTEIEYVVSEGEPEENINSDKIRKIAFRE